MEEKSSTIEEISGEIFFKEHPEYNEQPFKALSKHIFCLGFNKGSLLAKANSDASPETIDYLARTDMKRCDRYYDEDEKRTFLLGYRRGYSYINNK